MPHRKTTITAITAFLALMTVGPRPANAPLPEAKPTAEQVQAAVHQAELTVPARR